MIDISPLHPDLEKYLDKHQIRRKFVKQIRFLQSNPRHTSLKVELLEPKDNGIYSFRVDIKYRVLFIFRSDVQKIEILAITSHYK